MCDRLLDSYAYNPHFVKLLISDPFDAKSGMSDMRDSVGPPRTADGGTLSIFDTERLAQLKASGSIPDNANIADLCPSYADFHLKGLNEINTAWNPWDVTPEFSDDGYHFMCEHRIPAIAGSAYLKERWVISPIFSTVNVKEGVQVESAAFQRAKKRLQYVPGGRAVEYLKG